MENLERFLLSFDHPVDWMGRGVEARHLSSLKVGDVVRLFFRWEEGWNNKYYVRILEIEEGPVFRGETIEVYPQWSLSDGHRVPLGAILRFEPQHVYELPGFVDGQLRTWPVESSEEVEEEELKLVDSDYHECSDGDDY